MEKSAVRSAGPSLTAPVLCYGPVQWSPPSGSGGGSPMHAPLQRVYPDFKDYSNVKLPTNTPDVLTHPSHIGDHRQ